MEYNVSGLTYFGSRVRAFTYMFSLSLFFTIDAGYIYRVSEIVIFSDRMYGEVNVGVGTNYPNTCVCGKCPYFKGAVGRG